ncbi:recombinase family protein [Pedobacter nyackensis]|uniref:Recombinase n=1 Tax=Pedobacter nyackensis TaxID=475255 RepID=A0A1W2APG4_9SPHI|nr:recombinase family protein [Pedobacter nyackensis]SMC62420.1 Recombinase [Pedobacter nyackensis]
MPLNIIGEEAKKMGYLRKGKMTIERILKNPSYVGMVYARAFKEHPGGLFPARHEPLIDLTTWEMVQNKLRRPEKTRTIFDENIPLRGILKCHCGQPLTGAPSRGKAGRYYYYYKCKLPRHSNISAIKAHDQMLGITELMSLEGSDVKYIKETIEKGLDKEAVLNKKAIVGKREELDSVQDKLNAVEEKFISDQITRETYDRWTSNYNSQIFSLKAAIQRMGTDINKAFKILARHIDLLTDMKHVYTASDLLGKREFVKLVFDSNLYYFEGIYRTPTMLQMFDHNALKMKDQSQKLWSRNDFSVAKHIVELVYTGRIQCF